LVELFQYTLEWILNDWNSLTPIAHTSKIWFFNQYWPFANEDNWYTRKHAIFIASKSDSIEFIFAFSAPSQAVLLSPSPESWVLSPWVHIFRTFGWVLSPSLESKMFRTWTQDSDSGLKGLLLNSLLHNLSLNTWNRIISLILEHFSVIFSSQLSKL
jgi:hypothetical protein